MTSEHFGDLKGAGFDLAPFYQLPGESAAVGEAFYTTTEDGVRLRLGLWKAKGAATGTVLLFEGRAEYLEKYAPIAPLLTAVGLNVLVADWRGQGGSDRLLADPRIGHIDDFASYQIDVAAVVSAASALELAKPWHLLAHSMGGCIGLAALIAGLPVETAAFSAPMWGLERTLLPAPVITGISNTAERFGQGTRSAIGSGGRGTYMLDAAFRGNFLTDHPRHWARLVAEAGSWPELTLGGVSYTWLSAAMAECARLAALPLPTLPTIIGLGKLERVVSAQAVRNRAAKWASAELIEFPNTRHEIMFEREPAPQRFINAVLELFAGR